MEDAKQRAETSLSKFSHGLDQVEQTLRPVLKSLDELRASGNEEDLDSMSRARMHISLAYAVNTLFCMYLRTQGVDPATHPVSDEIGRVQDAFMQMRKVEAGLSVDHQRQPDRDRRRYYENMRRESQKLAGLIFPEEVDLLNAVRGKKRKRGVEQNEKGKKLKKQGKEPEVLAGDESDSSDDDRSSDHAHDHHEVAANPKHVTDSSGEENKQVKPKKRDDRNDQKKTAKKKKKKSKNDEGTDVNRDKKITKDKSNKKSKVDRESKKSKEQDDVSKQLSKASVRSEQKRKRKKKTK